jgi:hypothetical protein
MSERDARPVQRRDLGPFELGESRGKGLESLHTEPAHGVSVVSDNAPEPTSQPGPIISASDASSGPPDFDG